MKLNNKEKIEVFLPLELKTVLRKTAKDKGISMAECLKRAFEEWVK